jgi:hypothetical protein
MLNGSSPVFTDNRMRPSNLKHGIYSKILARMASNSWMCVGDFNKVLVPFEKLGGNLWQQSLMQAFQHTLEACELTDLGFFGPKYTWSNCQERNALIRERLDKGVANIA